MKEIADKLIGERIIILVEQGTDYGILNRSTVKGNPGYTFKGKVLPYSAISTIDMWGIEGIPTVELDSSKLPKTWRKSK